ncbi:MAG: hypothetical protein P8I55_00080 [Crocinitomix sp.]|nr:hypothetical protein [Crocinitomix sp.]|tara:strand:+ start:306 stop:449 length:144 start_codon:yes stop_codon:yes gene_type:complete
MKSPKAIVTLALLFFLPLAISAQTFTNIYGGDSYDTGRAICITEEKT